MTSIIKNGIAYNAVSTFCTDSFDTPLVLSIPHSGEIYPDDFRPRPDLEYVFYDRPADRYVHELFGNFQDLRIPTIKAEFPRAYVDVNRRQYDLPEEIMAEKWENKISRTTRTTMIWPDVYDTPLYDRKLSNQEIRNRIANCYLPYHQALTRMLERTREKYGVVYMLDCHSMAKFDAHTDKQRPEIDLGNRSGLSCADDITDFLKQAFEDKGYYVGVNEKFAGGELTQRYGWCEYNQHAIQIEFRRDFYMNEDTRERNENFTALQQDCMTVLQAFNTYLSHR